jgi:hypothetical protein
MLPKFFMIYKTSGYKFYKNTIMFLPSNSYNPVNVVTPLTNVTIQLVSKHSRSLNECYSVMTRGSLTNIYPFKFTYSGLEISTIMNGSQIIIPGVNFLECDPNILPRGSPVIIPRTPFVHWQNTASNYDQAEIATDSEMPITAVHVLPTPTVALVKSEPCIYPPHIKQLIISDSIHKNESCVITCELISQENACITTCGHVFTKSGLTQWLSVSSNKSCPICRQKCSLV